jgi:hypothetical protein
MDICGVFYEHCWQLNHVASNDKMTEKNLEVNGRVLTEVLSHLLEGLNKTPKNAWFGTSDIPADVRTDDLPNTSQDAWRSWVCKLLGSTGTV